MATATLIDTRTCAKLMKAALKEAFPGVQFSVRCDAGTASNWVNVRWHHVDGINWRDVQAVAGRYQGTQFDGSTDSYERLDDAIDENGAVLRYCCQGVDCQAW